MCCCFTDFWNACGAARRFFVVWRFLLTWTLYDHQQRFLQRGLEGGVPGRAVLVGTGCLLCAWSGGGVCVCTRGAGLSQELPSWTGFHVRGEGTGALPAGLLSFPRDVCVSGRVWLGSGGGQAAASAPGSLCGRSALFTCIPPASLFLRFFPRVRASYDGHCKRKLRRTA